MTVTVWLTLPSPVRTDGGAGALTYARHAEQCGFEAVCVAEHVIPIAGHRSSYPYKSSGAPDFDAVRAVADPLETLAYLAAGTKRILLTTGVLVLPCHNPLMLAKRAATIDVLSAGRLRLGVGVGWLHEELQALGVDPSTRGRRTDESIDVMRTLWQHVDDGADHTGEFFRFSRAYSYPKPHNGVGIPFVIGGNSRAAASRAGRRGDGFWPIVDMLPDDRTRLPQLRALMRQRAEDAGRDPDAISLVIGSHRSPLGEITSELFEFAESHGARSVSVSGPWLASFDRTLETITEFAARFITNG